MLQGRVEGDLATARVVVMTLSHRGGGEERVRERTPGMNYWETPA